MRPFAPAVVVCLTLFVALPAAAEERESCGTCHPASRVDFEGSIHAREEVTCSDCHGGDPRTLDVDEAHRGKFRSWKDRLTTPLLCAECHSDLERMRAYNLPGDQLAVYQTSQHGRSNAAGDRRAAVCTDCHGGHGILAPGDPASSVHPRNIQETCAACHADPDLTAAYDLDSSVVDDYRNSVHGRALLDEGNAAAPDCTSCHGVHGAAPPGFGDVDKVCGFCHAQTRRAFREGPHYQAMLAADLPECASCHSNHAISQFEADALSGICLECHGEDSTQAQLGRVFQTSISAAAAELDRAAELVQQGERRALDVEDYLARLEGARTALTEAPPASHAVLREPVEELTRRARSIGEEVQRELYAKLNRRPAHIGLAFFWFYLLTAIAILWVYRRQLERER